MVQSSQKELMEKVQSIKEQVVEQESHFSHLGKSLSSMKNEDSTLKW